MSLLSACIYFSLEPADSFDQDLSISLWEEGEEVLDSVSVRSYC